MSIRVCGLAVTAVKGTRLREVESVSLGPQGARGNRSFYVIDERGRMLNGKPLGALQAVIADYDEVADELALTFADGAHISGPAAGGGPIETRFFSDSRVDRVIDGQLSDALSEQLGRPLRLVATEVGVDRGAHGAVSLISRGSLARLAQALGTESLDARRFRMLIEIDGVAPHAEDDWVDRHVRAGEALLAFSGHVGRCMVTTRNPDSGEVDLRTLHALTSYRSDHPSAEPLPFGIYGAVLEPGAVSIGDAVAVEG
ncbi:MAG: MOSC domain-containing protein [Solirubrobacteraceae bacterium]